MAFLPVIADWIERDPVSPFAIETEIRFDSIEHDLDPQGRVDPSKDHMSVEFLTDAEAAVIAVEDWLEIYAAREAFVARIVNTPKPNWPADVEPNLDIKFDNNGTTLKVEQLPPGPGSFERSVAYVEPNGVPSLAFGNIDASDPMRLNSWVVYHNAVVTLIDLNNGQLQIVPGGL